MLLRKFKRTLSGVLLTAALAVGSAAPVSAAEYFSPEPDMEIYEAAGSRLRNVLYYGDWSIWGGQGNFYPRGIAADQLTHLNYAFAEPYMENGEYVGLGLQGGEDRFQKIVELKKKHPGLKICISFTDTKEDPRGGCFSRLAKSDEFRKKFAADCKAFVQKWGIDGVDMDWEFVVESELRFAAMLSPCAFQASRLFFI